MGKSAMNKLLTLSLLVVLLLSSLSVTAELSQQRQKYKELQNVWKTKSDAEVKILISELKEYPLYPYIQYRYLMNHLMTIESDEVTKFAAQYPLLPITKDLQNQFNSELIRRKDWQGYVKLVKNPPANIAGRCYYYYAQWMVGKSKVALQGTKELWLTGKQLPQSCDPLLDIWSKHGGQTTDLILNRIRLAFLENNLKLAQALVSQLPTNYKTLKSTLTQVINDPTKLSLFNEKVKPSQLTRAVVKSTFSRLARNDVNQAHALLPSLVKRQNLSANEQMALEVAIAWQLFGQTDSPKQTQYRDDIIIRSKNVALLENRIRLAITQNNLRDRVKWIGLLPESAKNKDVWRYWYADYLLSKGQVEQAETVLKKLATKRGYYAMLSAKRLGVAYSINPTKVLYVDHKTIDSDPTILRIKELLNWGMRQEASREWYSYVSRQNSDKQEQLARYALDQKWNDFSVQATIIGKFWGLLTERFPVTYHAIFKEAVAEKEITMYYAMAITRQESALNPLATSSAGARGLMQLMPATAKDAAKMANISDYSSANQLFDPEINIWLGTSYLDYVFKRFDNNRVLSTAAYNAGPSRVERWVKASDGQLRVDQFIETIPYNETRNYVQNVLSYDVLYRYFLGEKSVNLFTQAEWDRLY